MKTTATQYSKVLYELTKEKSQSEIDNIIINFAKMLQKNRQLNLAGKIGETFSEIYNAKHGIVEVEVVTREEVSNELRNKVSNYVSNKYQAKQVVMKSKIDKNIRGGIVIKVGDEIVDGSVARQLKELKSSLEK